MRKVILSLVAILAVLTPARSQSRPSDSRAANEVSIHWGYLSVPYMADIVAAMLGSAFSCGLAQPSHVSTTGAVGLEYFHYLGRSVAIGVDITGETSSLTFNSYSGKDSQGNAIYRQGDPQHISFLSVLPAVKLPWFYHEHFSMYTKLGAGVTMSYSSSVDAVSAGNNGEPVGEHKDAESSYGFGFQASLVGMDFGGKRTRGFLEAGAGMQGLVILGLRHAF